MKKILFVLSGNLSTTPRAYNAAVYALQRGYSVKLIGINREMHWHKLDQKLAMDTNLTFESIPLNRAKFFYALIKSFCTLASVLFTNSIIFKAYGYSKENFLLWKRLKKEPGKYHLVIGHSAHSLFPAWKYACRHKIPYVFDVEDFHPGQLVGKTDENQAFLLHRLLPGTYYTTYASPLIGQELQKLTGHGMLKNSVLINNCFAASEFEFNTILQDDKKVHFVWFSQNIGANRGLELVIPELKKVSDKIQLHLIGNLSPHFNLQWIEDNAGFISIYPPLAQPELNRLIGRFDIGMALELSNRDYNRQICLTNKIWAYLQSGLYIMASATPAQMRFMDEHPGHGISVEMHAAENPNTTKPLIAQVIADILANIASIRAAKQSRFEKAKHFSWENERNKLATIWDCLEKN